jgi:acetylornithine/succinyldiaminopimelate/putrescine aminotransferase
MGRTGTMFAFEQAGVVPDIMCLAKAFGGGMPLGAFIASRELMSKLSHDPALGHITTFGGHPVCCAAGLAALEYILNNGLLASVEVKGALYEGIVGGHPAVREIRRTGLLMAVELGDSARMYRLMELFIDRGILSDWFLFCDTAFRISPPLTITEDQIRESCDIILACLDEL